jgi:hypothetical protein
MPALKQLVEPANGVIGGTNEQATDEVALRQDVPGREAA